MIHFIALRHVADLIGGRFAYFDTVTDAFVADEFGEQTWATFDEFSKAKAGDDLVRFAGLTPEWAKVSATLGDRSDELMFPGIMAKGMTQRAYAAIHLRVPDSGVGWLDDMIREAVRNRSDDSELHAELTDMTHAETGSDAT